MEGIMNTYYSGLGSAEEEAQKSVESLNGRLNQLQNSWTDLIHDFFDTDIAADFVHGVDNITKVLDTFIEKIGAIPTILGSIGIGALVKNGGRTKLFVLMNMPPSIKFATDR